MRRWGQLADQRRRAAAYDHDDEFHLDDRHDYQHDIFNGEGDHDDYPASYVRWSRCTESV